MDQWKEQKFNIAVIGRVSKQKEAFIDRLREKHKLNETDLDEEAKRQSFPFA